MSLGLDLLLAALMLGLAGWTVLGRDMFAAIAAFIAYGLLLGIVWVRVGALDVALTEAAVGGGVTGGLLIAAWARLRATAMVERKAGAGLAVLAALASLGVAVLLAAVVLHLPQPAPTLVPEAMANLAPTGLGNPVSATLMAWRALDTLLEKLVLLLALLGIWSVAPDAAWGARPAASVDRDGALTFLAQFLPPVGVVVGIYTVWTSADAPGGAFQGGTILAAMWLLAVRAGLADLPRVASRWLRLALVAGPAVFLAVGLAGFVLAGHFLAYPEAVAKPLIVLIEAPMILSIGVSLALMVAGPPVPKGDA